MYSLRPARACRSDRPPALIETLSPTYEIPGSQGALGKSAAIPKGVVLGSVVIAVSKDVPEPRPSATCRARSNRRASTMSTACRDLDDGAQTLDVRSDTGWGPAGGHDPSVSARSENF